MSDPRKIPDPVLDVFYGLLALGFVIGALYGAGVFSGDLLAWIVLATVAVFVPWAVLQLDPRGLKPPAGRGGK